MALITQHTGEMAALAAALCWAVSTVMYRPIGYRLSPAVMNLYKGLIASALLVVTIGVGRVLSNSEIGTVQTKAAVLLAISGVIGIGLGDTFFFASLRHLGARRAMLLVTLSPPLTALIGLVYPGETPSVQAWFGIILTVAGVAWVITERANLKGPVSAEHHTGWGIVWGVLCAVTAAVAAVISRDAMDGTEIDADVSALIRIVAGTVTVCLILPALRAIEGKAAVRRPRMSARSWCLFVPAVFFGTFLGIWFFQVSLDHTQAGVAQTLVTTATLFVLPIAAVMGERISLRAIAGAVVAVLGIVLLISAG